MCNSEEGDIILILYVLYNTIVVLILGESLKNS